MLGKDSLVVKKLGFSKCLFYSKTSSTNQLQEDLIEIHWVSHIVNGKSSQKGLVKIVMDYGSPLTHFSHFCLEIRQNFVDNWDFLGLPIDTSCSTKQLNAEVHSFPARRSKNLGVSWQRDENHQTSRLFQTKGSLPRLLMVLEVPPQVVE